MSPLISARAFTAPPPPNFFRTLESTSQDIFYGVATDSDDNVYATGAGSSISGMITAKYNVDGTLAWQRELGGVTNTDDGQGIAVDSAGDVYVTGKTDTEATQGGGRDVVLVKYNSSGTIQWQIGLGNTSTDYGYAIAASGTDVVICGETRVGTYYNHFVAKYNSSGTLQWQREVATATTHNKGRAVTVDGSGNVYSAGYTVVSGEDHGLIMKHSSAGSMNWKRTLGNVPTGHETDLNAIHVNGSALYVTGKYRAPGYGSKGGAFTTRLSASSGNISWTRLLYGVYGAIGHGVTTDASGDVYMVGQSDYVSNNDERFIMAKYNSSGTLQWQRDIVDDNVNDTIGRGIAIDSYGNMIVVGETSVGGGTRSALIARVPGDGSGTGTYGTFPNFAYAVSTLSTASPTLNSTSDVTGESAGAQTSGTTTIVEAAGTLTDTSY